jgi:hypothetical protein
MYATMMFISTNINKSPIIRMSLPNQPHTLPLEEIILHNIVFLNSTAVMMCHTPKDPKHKSYITITISFKCTQCSLCSYNKCSHYALRIPRACSSTARFCCTLV